MLNKRPFLIMLISRHLLDMQVRCSVDLSHWHIDGVWSHMFL